MKRNVLMLGLHLGGGEGPGVAIRIYLFDSIICELNGLGMKILISLKNSIWFIN